MHRLCHRGVLQRWRVCPGGSDVPAIPRQRRHGDDQDYAPQAQYSYAGAISQDRLRVCPGRGRQADGFRGGEAGVYAGAVRQAKRAKGDGSAQVAGDQGRRLGRQEDGRGRRERPGHGAGGGQGFGHDQVGHFGEYHDSRGSEEESRRVLAKNDRRRRPRTGTAPAPAEEDGDARALQGAAQAIRRARGRARGRRARGRGRRLSGAAAGPPPIQRSSRSRAAVGRRDRLGRPQPGRRRTAAGFPARFPARAPPCGAAGRAEATRRRPPGSGRLDEIPPRHCTLAN
mmetsp:Transcript_15339/g.54599  ORF Transcript_15339/g.54599 Transcript_15339/m.54599 type:complete len:285 (-) Transcript_15339:24-878(-)